MYGRNNWSNSSLVLRRYLDASAIRVGYERLRNNMDNLYINKPMRKAETVKNYKYPIYTTYSIDKRGERIDFRAMRVVKRWRNHSKMFYRIQYQEYEILRVFWVAVPPDSDLLHVPLVVDGKPLNRYYARLAND